MKRFFSFAVVLSIIIFSAAAAEAVPLNQIYQIVEAHTVDPISNLELRQQGIEEISAFLADPYFKYFTPDVFKHFLDSHLGYYGGIGAQINLHEGKLLIWSVQAASPALAAGLRFGDEVIAVDGQDVRGLSALELAMLLRGVPGSKVTVSVVRQHALHTVTLTRVIIQIPTVIGYMRDNVAVIELSGFTAKTPQEFRVVLRELRLLLPHGLVLDMRGNPGGAMSAVLEIAKELIPAGPIVRLRTRQGGEIVLVTKIDPAPLPYLVLLVDEDTASAAEILAGAVQDSGAGLVVGKTSYGKGTVQSVFQLIDGGGLRLTTARFYTPLNRPIDRVGIVPDVEMVEENQLNFAVNLVRTNAARQMTFTIDRKDVWVHKNIVQADFPPFLSNNYSYIPLRLLAESMDYQVEWDADSFTAIIRQGAQELVVPLRKNEMFLNGVRIALEAPVLIRADRSYLPVRAVAEALGSRVYWNHDARQVTVAW